MLVKEDYLSVASRLRKTKVREKGLEVNTQEILSCAGFSGFEFGFIGVF